VGITTTVDSVTTGDAAPTTAPHKISAQGGKDQATVRFTPTNSTGHAITCWRIERGGSAPGTGTMMDMAGFPCSDSIPEALCSDSDARALCTDGLASASGTQIAVTVTYVETGSPADGGYTVNVYAGSDDTAIG
jgi:hypothetical protein